MLRIIASPGDAFASEVEAAASRSTDVERLAHDAAALTTTVELRASGVRVSPDVPTLLRPPIHAGGDTDEGEDDDERFLAGERIASLWAALALARSPVVNRPSRFGTWGRVAWSAFVTEHRAGLAPERAEVFANDVGSAGLATTGWAADGKFRARRVDGIAGYEAVTVAGPRSWRMSTEPLAHLALERRSERACAALGLQFAQVFWGIDGDASSATLARVVPAPTLAHLGPTAADAVEAVLGVLLVEAAACCSS